MPVAIDGTSNATKSCRWSRIAPELREEAKEVLAEMGLTISDAVRLLLGKVVAERRPLFEITVPPKPLADQ